MPAAVAAVAEAEEVVVVVEQLSNDDVGARVDFAFQVLQVHCRAEGPPVRLRIAGHGDAKPRELGLDQCDEFARVSQAAGGRVEHRFAGRWVTAQCDDVVDARLLGPRQVGAQLIDRRTDTGQVRRDRQAGTGS